MAAFQKLVKGCRVSSGCKKFVNFPKTKVAGKMMLTHTTKSE